MKSRMAVLVISAVVLVLGGAVAACHGGGFG
jgi:hypothetical protein